MLQLQLLVNGVLLAGLYVLIAVGLNLVFGVMRVINFAHGELVVLASLMTASAFTAYGTSPLLSLLAVVPVMFLLGYGIERLVIEPVVDTPQMVSLLTTFGLSLVLINGGLLLWGAEERAVPVLTGAFRIGTLAVPRVRVLTFGIAAAATLALYAFLRLSDWGRAVRATAQVPTIAQTCGIDVRRVRGLAFALATALAALAGSLLVIMIPVDPQVGGLLILKAFAVVVLGGLGNLLGALLGALVLANAEVFAAYYVSPVLSEAVAFLVLLALLLLRRHDPLAAGTA